MKTKIIKTDKCRLLIVDLSENVKLAWLSGAYKEKPLMYSDDKWTNSFDLPEGNWQLQGFLKDLTEDQWEMIVEGWNRFEGRIVEGKSNEWKNYNEAAKFSSNPQNCFCYSASESVASLIKANEVYLENEYAEPVDLGLFAKGKPFNKSYLQDKKNFDESEKKVWINPVVLIELKK